MDVTSHAEENPSRNDLSLAGGDDNNRDKENNGDNVFDHGMKVIYEERLAIFRVFLHAP